MYILMSFLFMVLLPVLSFLFMKMTKKISLSLEFFSPQNNLSECTLAFQVDYLSLIFFFSISLISTMVLLYSKFYMSVKYSLNTENNRFFFILLSFILSMMVLVFSSSWVMLMVGWDGLGLSSFLLVIFYSNYKSLGGGLLTFLTNRFGDALFIITFLNMSHTGWFYLEFLNYNKSLFFLLLMIMGAMTKSAQFPFSSWLPAAMAAPTPVSSLVHSSTLVTAGVFVLIRFNFLVQNLFMMLSIISLATMVMSGVSANMEMDFKKIIAMSTLSQLGFMMFTLSLGYWILAFFHVIFHAFFKSSLFLSTGSLMHEIYSIQDSRFYGNSQPSSMAKIYFISCCLSLMGFPFTLGFFSKDSILSKLSETSSNLTVLFFILSCSLTIAYSIRIIYLSFTKTNNYLTTMKKNEDKFFILPILLLVLLKTLMGNFFFTEFFFLSVYNWMESMLGILVFLMGVKLAYKKVKFGLIFNFFSTMSFLGLIFSFPMNMMNKWFFWKIEHSWGEVSSGMGVVLFLTKTLNSMKILNNIHLFPLIFILMVFSCL